MAPRRVRTLFRTILAAAALLVAILVPNVAVLAVLVAGNLVLGQAENVPFSAYGMFSKPTTSSWSLRFEDLDGSSVAIGKFGLLPSSLRKTFASTVAEVNRSESLPASDARERAAFVVTELIDDHRSRAGELGKLTIVILHTEYRLDQGAVITTTSRVGLAESP